MAVLKKKVIFIVGSNFSGSTLAGCVLGANKLSAFENWHVGEIHSFFKPQANRYGKPEKAVLSSAGAIWDSVDYSVGYHGAYDELIYRPPETDVLIDSSKTPNNLEIQLEHRCQEKFDFRCVMTYKPFNRIWLSSLARGNKNHKIKSIILNYRRQLNLLKDYRVPFIGINTEDFIGKPELHTEALCEFCEIPYFSGKHEYWRWPFAHLYGSDTQRDHLNDPSKAGYDLGRPGSDGEFTNDFLEKPEIKELEKDVISHLVKL